MKSTRGATPGEVARASRTRPARPAPRPAPRARLAAAVAARAVAARAVAAAAVGAAAAPARAQTPAPGPAPVPTSAPADTVPGRAAADTLRDSVLARLQRAEESIALLRQQLAAQAASATQTSSRVRFDLSGRVLVNGFANSRRVNNADVPQFVAAFPDTGRGSLGGAVRQTTLSGAVFAPRVLGGSFTGDVNVDFYGGQQASPGGRHFPNLRLRNARGVLRWRHYELLVGQDVPMVAAVEPVSLAAVGVAEFGTAGNLWIWLPQVRATAEFAPGGGRGGRPAPEGALRLGVQAAVLAPNNGDAVGLFDTQSDAAERSRRPFVQGRVRARWGEEERAGEVGVGYHRGWIADPTGPPAAPLIASDARVVNALLPFGGPGGFRFDVRGEAYSGQALRGLGGGGIAQTFAAVGVNTPQSGTTPAVTRNSEALRTRGGWAQANVRYLELFTLGGGCGVDAPRNPPPPPAAGGQPNPFAAGFRRRNNVCEGHVILRPEGPIVVGLTYRYTRTRYAAGPITNDHVNLAFGYQF